MTYSRYLLNSKYGVFNLTKHMPKSSFIHHRTHSTQIKSSSQLLEEAKKDIFKSGMKFTIGVVGLNLFQEMMQDTWSYRLAVYYLLHQALAFNDALYRYDHQKEIAAFEKANPGIKWKLELACCSAGYRPIYRVVKDEGPPIQDSIQNSLQGPSQSK